MSEVLTIKFLQRVGDTMASVKTSKTPNEINPYLDEIAAPC